MREQQNTVVTLEKKAPTAFRIIPAGAFSANDGRPNGNWFLSENIARSIIAKAAQGQQDYLIDYEHQSIDNHVNKKIVAAAGWFKQLEWRPDGLYVVDARWTPKAKAMIEGEEYRYISPVFGFDKDSGNVTNLYCCALTNTPALMGLTDLSRAAATAQRQGQSEALDLSGMSEREREVFTHAFGHLFPEIAAATATTEAQAQAEQLSQDLAAMSERDREVFIHTFGDVLGLK